jgi:hypothetical protein
MSAMGVPTGWSGQLEWATEEVLLKLFNENFDASGLVKPDGVPVLAKGTFAVVFRSEDVAGAAAAGFVVRVAVSPPGADQEFSFQKELQALIAYLKLTPLAGDPVRNTVVTIASDEQPVGLCKINCYYGDCRRACPAAGQLLDMC